MITCSNCGTQLPDGYKFCEKCGAKIVPCIRCGHPLSLNAKFCGKCGYPSKQTTQTVENENVITQPHSTGGRKMSFVKARPLKSKEESLFNTDMIVKISKTKGGYIIFFSSGNVGSAYYEFDEANARPFFDAIGLYL